MPPNSTIHRAISSAPVDLQALRNRKRANEIAEMTVIGDVRGKDVIIVDDMCDTAGTLTTAADLLMEKGALSVRAFCTHAVLSGPAYERIANSKLTELIVTDTIPLAKSSPKIRVVAISDLFADVIKRLINKRRIIQLSIYYSNNFVILETNSILFFSLFTLLIGIPDFGK